MSTFDPDSFLNQEIDANFDSEYTPTPEGEWEAQLDKLVADSFTVKNGEHAGEERPFLKATWRITDQEVIDETGIEEPRVTQTIFLDVENGALATGANKNIMLGKLREMAGLADKPFAISDLVGTAALIKVKHKILDDGRPAAEVKGVTEI